jgi:hypothetical protein
MGEASATSLKPARSVLLRVSPMVAEVMDTGNAAFQVTITLQEIFHVGKGDCLPSDVAFSEIYA